MTTDIKEIRKEELGIIIKENEQRIVDTQEQLRVLQEERARLTSPDIVRTFNWFQKNITQRAEYKKYVETAADNRARLIFLDEDIAFAENKIADAKQQIGNGNRKTTRLQTINSLEELDIKTFEDAKTLLESNDKELVLEKGDKIPNIVPSNFRSIEDFCFIHKTNALPDILEMASKYELGGNTQTEVLIGETFQSMSVPNWEKTLHGTINSIDQDLQSKYAVLSPFKDLDKSRLISTMPNNTFFDSSISIPNNSYILVPQDELDLVGEKLKNNPNINIVGYNNNVEENGNNINLNNALSILMNNLGYVEQELTLAGWENSKAFLDFQTIVTPTLESECKIHLDNIVGSEKQLPFEASRFLPYSLTKYLDENSSVKKKHCFTKALESLHENIDELSVTEKKLKTKTIVDYDREALKSDPKDKSTESIDDVFGDFISILKTRDSDAIDKYLESVDKRYLPDRKNFRDELLKSTARLKNDGPVRNAFFSNILERFLHLEIEKENEVEETIENVPGIPEIPGIPETKDIDEMNFERNEFGEIIRDAKGDDSTTVNKEEIELEEIETDISDTTEEETADEKKQKMIDNLQKIAEEIDEKDNDDFEIVIEPMADLEI